MFTAMKESGENYLETILMLMSRQGRVRATDVARELDYSRPSVSRALGILKEKGLLSTDGEGYLRLSDDGAAMALEIYGRHTTLTRFLCTALDMDTQDAERDACRIEHVISDDAIERMKKYLAAVGKL